MLNRKKICALFLAAVLAVEGISGTYHVHAQETENKFASLNPGFDEAGEDKIPYWWYGSSADISVVEDNDAAGGKCVKVEPSGQGKWIGCATNATEVLEDEVTYEYSFRVKLGENAQPGTSIISPVINRIYDENFTETDQDTVVNQEQVTLSNTEWKEVTGNFTMDFNPTGEKEAQQIHFILNGDTGETFYVDELVVTAPDNQTEIIKNGAFESDTEGWYASTAGNAQLVHITEPEFVHEGSGSVKITGRDENWNCLAQDITGNVENGAKYDFSFWVKLGNEYGEREAEVQLGTTKKDSNDSSEQYDKLAVEGGKVMASSKEWRQVTGVLTISYTGTLEKLEFKIAEQGEAVSGSSWGDYYVDDVVITKQKENPIIIQDITPLKEHLAQTSVIGGKAGVAIPVSALADEKRMELVTKHFNSITCENEMKPDAFLGSTPTFQTINGEQVLQLDFSQADAVMDFVKNYNDAHSDNPIGVRGHVLVWHSQTPDWFFREGYQENGAYVSKEVMLGRMEQFIKAVIEHYDGPDSKYKGIIYAWDVVNEQIEPSDYDKNKNPDSIRIALNGTNTGWYHVFQGDKTYITQAFVYANKYAPQGVKLFYNDYGETDPMKRDAICKLLKDIKGTDGARIDGMGMQGHYSMDTPTTGVLEQAIRAYAEVVDEIQLTELDLQSSKNFDGTDREMELTKQAYRYKDIFDTITRLDAEAGIELSGVTIWGTHDGASWLQTSSSVGGGADGKRIQMPLLFDDNYQAKPAYYGIVDSSQLNPLNQKVSARYSETNFSIADKVSYNGASGEISFRVIWTETGMKLKVNVSDETIDSTDKIVVYVDTENGIKSYAVDRKKAVSTAEGYETEIKLSTSDVGKLSVGSKVKLDIVAYDKDTAMAWNDLKYTQEQTSEFYGEVVCKPFTMVPKGTPVVDGEMEDIWENTNSLPLTITLGGAEVAAEVRSLWDGSYLYSYFIVKDEDVSKASVNAWEQDSVEIFVDQNNGKTDSYDADDSQYRVNFDNEASFNGVNCNSDNLVSSTKKTADGYVVEMAIRWIGDTPETKDLLGLEFQVNDGTSAGTRAGTVSWYDESGNGFQSSAAFGTVQLVDKLPGKEPGDDDKDKDEDKDKEKNQIEVEVQGNGFDVKILNSLEELKKIIPFTEEEKKSLENGEKLSIKMIVNDYDLKVTENDRQVILKQVEETLKSFRAGKYLDLTLEKKVGDFAWTNVTKLNGDMRLQIGIPDNLKAAERVFAAIRIHDKEGSVLQDQDKASYTLTIATDHFSVYTIMYSDGKPATPENQAQKTDLAKTGDNTMLAGWLLMLGFASVVLVQAGRRKVKLKKNR